MATAGLSEAFVRDVTSAGKPDRLIADNRQANLYLRVLASGRKSWLLRARDGARWHVETLGEWRRPEERAHGKRPHLSVGQARLKAASALQNAMHPSAIARERITLKQAADHWYRERVEHRHRRPEQTKRYLDRDLTPIAGRPLARVTRAEVARLIAAKAPTAGNRLLAILKQLFRYAVVVGWLEADPLSVLTRRSIGTIEKPRERKLSDEEIRRLWAIEPPHGNIYRFLLASGQRLGEVLSLAAEPSQVRDGLWVIDDNKSGRPHQVPMASLMKKLFREGLPAKKRCAAWQMWKARMQCDATVHDIRRTVATRLRELRVPVEVIEALLNHAPQRLVRTYQQPDMTPQIADALRLWHRELQQIVATKI